MDRGKSKTRFKVSTKPEQDQTAYRREAVMRAKSDLTQYEQSSLSDYNQPCYNQPSPHSPLPPVPASSAKKLTPDVFTKCRDVHWFTAFRAKTVWSTQ